MAKPPGLRQRGGSWEMRVRVPDRLRATIGKREVVKSFGGVSTREAYRLGWHERAEIERLFERAEVKLGHGRAVLPPKVAGSGELSEDQLLAIARKCLHELEASACPVPLDDDAQRDLREAFSEEAFNLGRLNAVEDATIQHFAEGFFKRAGLTLPSGKAGFPVFGAIRDAVLEHTQRQLYARLD